MGDAALAARTGGGTQLRRSERRERGRRNFGSARRQRISCGASAGGAPLASVSAVPAQGSPIAGERIRLEPPVTFMLLQLPKLPLHTPDIEYTHVINQCGSTRAIDGGDKASLSSNVMRVLWALNL